jgi:hypothetical protein
LQAGDGALPFFVEADGDACDARAIVDGDVWELVSCAAAAGVAEEDTGTISLGASRS